MKAVLISFILLITTSAFAEVDATRSAASGIEQTKIIPNTTENFFVQVEKNISTGKIRFEKCNTLTAACQPIGKSEGYSLSEIEARYSQLVRNKWLKRLVVPTAGAACAALLLGTYTYMGLEPIREASNQLIDKSVEFAATSRGLLPDRPVEGMVAMPVTMTMGMVGAEVGLMGHLFSAMIVGTYATVGAFFGAPTAWLAVRFFTEPTSKAAKALKGAVKSDGTNFKYNGNITNLERYLLVALEN